MKIHRNLAIVVIRGLELILIQKQALRPSLNKILKQNNKWGSRDRRTIGEALLDCIRWKRYYEYLGDLNPASVNYLWELFGVWILTKQGLLANWEEFSNIQNLKLKSPQNHDSLPLQIRASIPDWLDELGRKSFKETVWKEECQALNEQAPLVLRANTLKGKTEALLHQLNKDLTLNAVLSKEVPEAIVIDKHLNLSQHPFYREGRFEIQDANSQRVAHWVKPKAEDLIIDACAGSGGKSLHLAALMENKGKIIAFDNAKKLELLKKRAARNGVTIIETIPIDIKHTKQLAEGSATAVLIDAPCSGLGVLRRNPAAKWHMNPKKIEALLKLQEEILQKNALLVKKGGLLVYATCSIFPDENQYQITRFLDSEKGQCFELEKAQTFLTHQTQFDGFYIAKLKRKY